MTENTENIGNTGEDQENAGEKSVDELIDRALEAARQTSDDIEMTVNEADTAKQESDEDDAASEYNDNAAAYAELEEQLSDANEKYLRLFAEYDNYRKRTAREKTETYSNASAKCVEELLPVIDSFERALEAECTDKNFKDGMSMIFNQLSAFLTKLGVTEIEALGAQFDPNLHNAVQQQSGTDYAADHVCAVFQKGYMLGGKLIRPAMVAVAL
ncbi:MAG: nucleotide exchange factor GrpE [Ruminococcus sp.]|nr:nucleotide exchange factor GrpE [Ruminococcus sp.]